MKTHDDALDKSFMNQRAFMDLTGMSSYRMKKAVEKGLVDAVIIDGYYIFEKESVKKLLGLSNNKKSDLFSKPTVAA
jgi:hypothetical protein